MYLNLRQKEESWTGNIVTEKDSRSIREIRSFHQDRKRETASIIDLIWLGEPGSKAETRNMKAVVLLPCGGPFSRIVRFNF
jgi:hypothetical protein